MTKKRNEDASCETCIYWEADPGKNNYEGKCRRQTPTTEPECPAAVWPTTSHYNWCGEHPDFIEKRAGAL